MPGLIRGVARTAVVAGTATAVSNRVSRRQANRWAEQGQAQPGYMAPVEPSPQQYYESPTQQYQEQQYSGPQAPQPDMTDQLRQLAQLRSEGILTDEEFTQQKAKLLGQG
jgi:hypothetical protein